jgi:hypothetical protein
VTVAIEHVVFGYGGVRLLLHHTGQYKRRNLDEHLTSVCLFSGGKIHRIDTYISDGVLY